MQQHRKYCVAEHIAIKGVGIRSAPALEVAFGALAIASVIVLVLTDSGIDSRDDERNGIGRRLKGKPEFLFRSHRYGIGNVRDVEAWNNAKNALVFLRFELFSSELLFGFGGLTRWFRMGGLVRFRSRRCAVRTLRTPENRVRSEQNQEQR